MLGQLIQKLNTENSLTQDLEELSLEGFSSLENILSDIKNVLVDVKAELKVMANVARETLEIQREALVLAGLKQHQDGDDSSSETEDSETEKSMLDTLKNISGKVGLTGLAMGLFTGLVGLAKIALPLLFTALGAYIATRWENFDLENELDRMAFAGVTGAGLGALIGGLLFGPIGALVGGLFLSIGGMIAAYAIENETIANIKEEWNRLTDGLGRFVDSIKELFTTVADFITGDSIMNFRDRVREYMGLDTKEEADARIEQRTARSNLRNMKREKSEADRLVKTYTTRANNANTEEERQYYIDKANEQQQISESIAAAIPAAEAQVTQAADTYRRATTMDEVNSMSFHMDDGDTGDILTPPVSALQRLQNEARTDSAAGQPAISMQQVDASSSSVNVKNETVGVKGQGALRSVGRGAERRRAAVN